MTLAPPIAGAQVDGDQISIVDAAVSDDGTVSLVVAAPTSTVGRDLRGAFTVVENDRALDDVAVDPVREPLVRRAW